MSVDWRIKPLQKEHDRTRLSCGEPELDDYLARFARQNHESGVSRTFVAVRDSEPTLILGYYSLTVGTIQKAELPPQRFRFPNYPLPVAILARLAVDNAHQGQGIAKGLLYNALVRCSHVAKDIGIIAVIIDAKSEGAKQFYSRYEFDTLPNQPLTLWLPLPLLRKFDIQPLPPE